MFKACDNCEFDPMQILEKPLMLHLATNSEHGPRSSPLWFLYEEERIWLFGISTDSFVQRLKQDSRCAFTIVDFDLDTGILLHVGVRGKATAHSVSKERLDRFVGKYLGQDQSGWNNWFINNIVAPLDTMFEVEVRSIIAKDVSFFKTGPKLASKWKKEAFPLIVDDQISLNLLDDCHTNALFELVDANRDHLREFLGWLDFNTSPGDTSKFIKSEIDKRVRSESLTLTIHVNHVLKGLIALNSIDHLNHTASIGYWMSKDTEGQGVMTKSVQKLIEFSFLELGLHRLEIRCALDNNKSKNIAERLGFKREGVLKEAISHYGHYFDAYTYALLKK